MKKTYEELLEDFKKAAEEGNAKLREEIKIEIEALKKVDPKDRPDDKADTKDEELKFASLGEQLKAIADVEIKHKFDPRLKAASGANEGVGAEGGYTRVAHDKSCYMLETPKVFTTLIGVTM